MLPTASFQVATWAFSFAILFGQVAHVFTPHDSQEDGKVHRYWSLVRSVRVGRCLIQQTVAQANSMSAGACEGVSAASDRRSGASAAVQAWRRSPDRSGAVEGHSDRAVPPIWRCASGAGAVARERVGGAMRAPVAAGKISLDQLRETLALHVTHRDRLLREFD